MEELPPQKQEYGSFKIYLLGFAISVLLTYAIYWIAERRALSGLSFDLAISSLGTLQAVLLLVLFFNLGREPKPDWNLVTFLFMVLVLAIIVVGSIWIMHHLNYNLMFM